MRRNYDQVTQSVLSVLISSYQFLSVLMGLKLRELGRKISRSETRPPGRSGLSFRSHSGYIQAFFRLHASRLHSGCFRLIQAAFRLHSGRIQAVLGGLACSGSAPGARFFRLAASGWLLYVSGEIVTPSMRRSDPERSF